MCGALFVYSFTRAGCLFLMQPALMRKMDVFRQAYGIVKILCNIQGIVSCYTQWYKEYAICVSNLRQ